MISPYTFPPINIFSSDDEKLLIIIDVSKKFNGRKVYVATGFLDSMMKRKKPSAAEISDIIASLQMGAAGIVLAAETAIGKFPFETLAVLKKHIDFYHSI